MEWVNPNLENHCFCIKELTERERSRRKFMSIFGTPIFVQLNFATCLGLEESFVTSWLVGKAKAADR